MSARNSAGVFVGVVLLVVGLFIFVVEVVPALSATTVSAVLSEDSGLRDPDSSDSVSVVPRSARTRQHGDEVVFRYQDEGFTAVYLIGGFNDWHPQLMTYNGDRGIWSLVVHLESGHHRYQFMVEDGDEQWEAIDPSNPNARRDSEHGWISTLEVVGAQAEDATDDDVPNDDDGGAYEYRFGWEDDDDEEDFEDRRWGRRNHDRYLHRELDALYQDRGDGVSFQRVDGFSVFATPSLVSREPFGPALKARFSYGFRSENWTLSGTLLQPVLENRRMMMRLSVHSGTDYRDQTGIGGVENSLAAAFFTEDFRDYYCREGIAISLVGFPTGNLRMEAGFESSDYTSLETRETWSLGDGDFTENPAINEGTLRAFFAGARIGSRNNNLDLAYEYSGEDVGGDFDFSLMKATYRARLPLGDTQYFDFRTRYSSALSGVLPVQRRSPVGGLGTVRGYYYKTLLEEDPNRVAEPLGAQRALIGNFEYGFSFDSDVCVFSDEWDEDWDGFDSFSWETTFILFFDTGMAWENRETSMDVASLKSSAGIGWQFDDDLRVDIIKPLEDGGNDLLFQVRLKRMF